MPASEYCPTSSKRTNIYIIGGDPATADGEYILETADDVCSIHTKSSGGRFRESDHDWDKEGGGYSREDETEYEGSNEGSSDGGGSDADSEADEEIYEGNVIDESEEETETETDGAVVDTTQ